MSGRRRARLTLGPRQAEALFDAAMMGREDMRDMAEIGGIYSITDCRRVDEALTRLAQALQEAKS